jgi:hypothetical protein
MADSEWTPTRRSLLTAGAGALAAGLVRPAGAGAASELTARAPRVTVASADVGTLLAGRPRTLRLPQLCDLLGASWRGPAHPGLLVRFRTTSGAWSPWASADDLGHGPDTPAPRSERSFGEPFWTGGTSVVQVRSDAELEALKLHLIDVSGGAGAATHAAAGSEPGADAAAATLATPVLASGPGQPPIIARRVWAQGAAPPRVRPGYGAVRMAFVHHTENPNGYAAAEVPAMLRAIWAFHRFVRGWNDIGYNFVIDLYGRVWEARAGGIDLAVVGAHAGGYNLVSTGVAILGSFMSEAPTAVAQTELQRLLAWKLALHGAPTHGRVTVRVNPAGAIYSRFPANARVSLQRIAGHRDADTTDCPGDVLYARLPATRAAAGVLAPDPVRLTMTISVSTPAPGPPPTAVPAEPGTPSAPASAPAGGPLTGMLGFLGGAPIAGAQVLVQALAVRKHGQEVRETTIGEAVSDATGAWTLAGSTYRRAHKHATLVRALYAGAPGVAGAAMSDVLEVSPVPAAAPPTPAPAPTSAGAQPPAP